MTLNILIVDDSPVMRSFVKLSGVGVGLLLEAGEGAQALVVLKEHPVHLVLTDINMPVMNGEQLVRAMRSDPLLAKVPVLVVSTDARLDRVDQMMDLGAAGYVTKPFTPELLRNEVERVLGVVHG
jgi:two-component system chemotaxis response regulator CheY